MKMFDVIPSKLFDYDSKKRLFTTDASMLRGLNISTSNIKIQSAKTGEVKCFTLIDAVRDFDGDVAYWSYTCEDMNLAVKIFND
jgi:hypothetical protein